MTTPLYINPLTDYGFKKVFGDEEIMCAFLNDLLKPESPIVHITFINKDVLPENDELRGIVYDMRCRTDAGSEIIVEMQNRGQIYFRDRILYYLSQSISPQGYKGRKEIDGKLDKNGDVAKESWDFSLKPVYGIFFLNFQLDKLKPQLIRTVRFMVEETNEIFNDKIRAYTIELPCMKGRSAEECKNIMEYWSYNLYNMEDMNTQLAFTDKRPIFMRMAEVANFPSLDSEQQRLYMQSLNNYRTVIAAKKYDFTRGEESGFEKGRAEGRAEGILQSAKLMLENGISKEQVMLILNLSEHDLDGI